MSDCSLLWDDDLASGSTGDVGLLSGASLSQQRILRRLLTNPGDYLWQPEYGAGLGQFIGEPCDVQAVRAQIRSQIFLEAIVARVPEPVIDVRPAIDGSVYVQITFSGAPSGNSQTLSFVVSV